MDKYTLRILIFHLDGGSVNITGSWLTGTLGTRKEIGTISDTITVEANNTESSKSGSKTYYYNNDSILVAYYWFFGHNQNRRLLTHILYPLIQIKILLVQIHLSGNGIRLVVTLRKNVCVCF